MKFKIPPKLKTDFDDFLDTAGIDEQVFDCEVYKDWYSPDDVFTERVELYADSSKSRYDNSDNRINARFKRAANVDKGDIIKTNTNEYYVLDWDVLQETNNRPTRALRCNFLLNVLRHKKEEVNDRGIVVTPERDEYIVTALPANISEYDGRISYAASSTTPGPASDILVNVVCQYNDETAAVCVGDKFSFGTSGYAVVNVNYSGMNVGMTNGCITIQAKKVPGEERRGT